MNSDKPFSLAHNCLDVVAVFKLEIPECGVEYESRNAAKCCHDPQDLLETSPGADSDSCLARLFHTVLPQQRSLVLYLTFTVLSRNPAISRPVFCPLKTILFIGWGPTQYISSTSITIHMFPPPSLILLNRTYAVDI
jgi:hypothetical protein